MPIPEDFDFPAEVEKLEALPADARALYIKSDGKFILDPVVAKRVDSTPLASALDKERKKVKELEKFNSAWRSLGLGDTPEEAKASIDEQLAALDPDNPDDKKQIKDLKTVREKLAEEFKQTLAKEVGERDEKLNKMQRSLQKHMLEKEAVAALSKHKGSVDLLLPHVVSKLALVEEGDELVVRVLDKDGDPLGDGKGGFMTVDQFVAQLKAQDTYARAFDASGKTGTGVKPHTGSKPGSPDRSSVQKISAGLSRLGR